MSIAADKSSKVIQAPNPYLPVIDGEGCHVLGDAERVGLIEGGGAARRLTRDLHRRLGQRNRLSVKIIHIIVKRRVVDEFA